MHVTLGLSGEIPPASVIENFNGIGLLRGEYICRKHGIYINAPVWKTLASDYITSVLDNANGKAVWYRFAELETFEVNILAGCDQELDNDSNPAIGVRGVRRAQVYQETFRKEVALIARFNASYPNLGVIIPFVTDPSDIRFVVSELKKVNYKGLVASMIETPAALMQIEDCIDAGLDKIVMGLNDLSSLLLAKGRAGSKKDYLHPMVLSAIKAASTAAKNKKILIAIAGYLPNELLLELEAFNIDEVVLHHAMLNNYSEFTKTLVTNSSVANSSVANSMHKKDLLKEIKQSTKERIAERMVRVAPLALGRVNGWYPLRQKDNNEDTVLEIIAFGFSAYGSNPLKHADNKDKSDLEKWHKLLDFVNTASQRHTDTLNANMSSTDDADSETTHHSHQRLVEPLTQEEINLGRWNISDRGRRRLEQEMAASYGAEDSILVNSKLLAVGLCLQTYINSHTDIVVVSQEASQTLEGMLDSLGLKNSQVQILPDTNNQSNSTSDLYLGDIDSALITHRPRAILLNSYSNLSTTQVLTHLSSLIESYPNTMFIIDNSVQSGSRVFFDKPYANLIVIESGAYFTFNPLELGVIYGGSLTISKISTLAFNIGQFLHGKAVAYLSEPFIRHNKERMTEHLYKTQIFVEALKKHIDSEKVVILDGAEQFKSALIFIRIEDTTAEDLRILLDGWRQATFKHVNTVCPKIKVGLGNVETTANVYTPECLARDSSPICSRVSILRISIGLEPTSALKNSAILLCKSIVNSIILNK